MGMLGGILGGVAGGLLGGPLGALAGGFLGSSVGGDPAGLQAGGTVYDPFGSHRAQFGDQLTHMMSPGSKFNTDDPSYQWRFDQGMESVNRGSAASGLLNSGNRLAELTNYGQGAASQEFQNQFSRLATLSGASTAPMQSSYGANQSQGMGMLAGMFGGGLMSSIGSFGSDSALFGDMLLGVGGI